MDKTMTSTLSEIRALLDSWSEAARTKDIDQLMSLYAPDITYFDVVPPLQYTGSDAVRRNFLRWFDGWEEAIGVEIRDLNILASEDVAAAHMLHRTSGTLKTGRIVDYWVRATIFCQRVDQRWYITHEHISLPVNPVSWSAVLDLVP